MKKSYFRFKKIMINLELEKLDKEMGLCLEAQSRRKQDLQVEYWYKEIADVYAKILKKYKAMLLASCLKNRSFKFPLGILAEVFGWNGSRLGLLKPPLLF